MTIKAPDVTLTGTLTDPQGNTVSGTLTFTLAGFGATVPLISGVQALPGLTFTTTVIAGVFSTTFYSNLIITPGPLVTFYNISFQPAVTTTTVFAFSENFQFSPGTFDFSQLIPLNAVLANTSLPNTVTPHTFASQPGQFLTGLTATGNFTSALSIVELSDILFTATTASINFSSIPASYKHLRIEIQGRADTASTNATVILQFNGDTGSNYDSQNIQNLNTTITSTNFAAAASIPVGVVPGASAARASIAGAITIAIPNYSSTTFEKSLHAESCSIDSTAANDYNRIDAGSWRNTAAITSIKIFPSGVQNWIAGTRATLYGLN